LHRCDLSLLNYPTRLPDGLFSNQKSQFGKILEGFGMERIAILFGHLKYITALWYILWPFVNLVAIWYFTPVLVHCVKKKNLATLPVSAIQV
jgi:hypothetical protein